MSSSLKRNLGQSLIIGLKGPALEADEADFIVDNNIGGVILFDRNVESPIQLRGLCSELQKLSQKMPDRVPLFISIDMEGGRVARLKEPFTQWPAAKKLGILDSTSAAFKMANYMGQELAAVGINMNFSPCVDLLTNSENKAIGDRSLGTDPEAVSKLASALVRGFVKANIIACAKHFPGHGNTSIDSHDDLPVEDTTLEQLETREMIPFKKTFRARLDFVMTAHIKFPKVDPTWPASLSSVFINDILKEKGRFRNLVITDDLDMKALIKHYDRAQIAVRAYQAGSNVLLYCNDPESPKIAMDALIAAAGAKSIDALTISNNHKKIIEVKKDKIKNFNLPAFSKIEKLIGNPIHKEVALAIEEGRVPSADELDA